MDAYESLTLIGKILLGIYLVFIPWTLGMWIWVPGGTALYALGATFAVLINSPGEGASHQDKVVWAQHVFMILGYDVYFIVAVIMGNVIAFKWMDREDRRGRERKLRQHNYKPPTVTVTRVYDETLAPPVITDLPPRAIEGSKPDD